jgi:ribosomal-protein-alanine N-acetyltransferase
LRCGQTEIGRDGQDRKDGQDGQEGKRLVQLTLKTCDVRSWRTSDAESLLRHANNRNIWLNLRDAFPHPYTKHDARAYIRSVRERTPETTFAIAVDDEAVGSVGFVLRTDVERVSAEIGYWLAEPFWGRGITTEALTALTKYAVDTHGLTRIYALPFAWNRASCRVLEKAGYVLEARLRRSAIKDGQITDQMQYAYIA